MDYKKYRAHPAISNSDLTLINRSVEHFLYARENPRPQTPALKFGTDFHCYVLEPEAFKAQYILLPEDIKPGNSNAYKDFKAKAEKAGKSVVDSETVAAFKEMKSRIDKLKLLTGGVAESSLFGKITAGGQEIEVKCRPDYRTTDIVFDLKTTNSADKEDFDGSVRMFRYFVQGAFYLEIARQNFPLIEKFVFIAIEKEPPYGVACYELDAAYLAAGKIQYMRDLEKYVFDSRKKNKGYESGVNIVSPPVWFANQYFNK